MHMSASDSSSDGGRLARDVMQRFFVADHPGELPVAVEEVRALLPGEYGMIAGAFAENIRATASTVGMPVALAYAAAEGSHWQRIHTAQRIRALRLDRAPEEDEATLEARREKTALAEASEMYRAFCASSEGTDVVAADACRFLLDALHSPGVEEAASELLLQGEVLAWSAFEILARSLFEAIVNNEPERILAILRNPLAKKRLPDGFGIEALAAAGFNVSTSLGTLLAGRQDFSDLRTIRAVLPPATHAEQDAAAALADERLWILQQRRHLVVHRRAKVDVQYLEAVGERVLLGSKLTVTPEDLEVHLEAVVGAGVKLLRAAGIPDSAPRSR